MLICSILTTMSIRVALPCTYMVGPRRIDFRLIYTIIEACILRNEKNQTASESVPYSVEEESMSNRSLSSCYVKQATSSLIALSCLTLSGLAAADTFAPVPKAVCGRGDHPETALQGQVPAALRAAGFQGFNCNLELVGQSRGDGASWQHAWFQESPEHNGREHNGPEYNDSDHNGREHKCAYYDTSSSTAGRTHLGTVVLDVSDASNPRATDYLTSVSMLDPWESLRTNVRRQILAAESAKNGKGGPEFDVYDIALDCRHPQLLSSIAMGTASNGDAGALPSGDTLQGHEGTFAPDGLTYYGGDRGTPTKYTAIDVTDTAHPRLMAVYTLDPGVLAHGLSISNDGNRAYVSLDTDPGVPANFANLPAMNGVLILDTSEIQAREPNPQFKAISKIVWKNGSHAQHTIPVKIHDKPYLVAVDEGGSGGLNGMAGWQEACNAGLTAFNMARIINIRDEANPKVVSELMLEVHDPANCRLVLPDLIGLASFTYGSHYCSVDDRHNATTLACGYFNSGIRVFDIRDPTQPKEIAYYNPAGTTTQSPGSNHGAQWVAGGPDWCNAQVHLDAKSGSLQTTCQDNGFLALKFTHGVWPFKDSQTPPGEQN